jgi:hypothetical protein
MSEMSCQKEGTEKMTEEIKNLRVTKELFDHIRTCQSCGAIILHQSVWKDAEPAPPVDWLDDMMFLINQAEYAPKKASDDYHIMGEFRKKYEPFRRLEDARR